MVVFHWLVGGCNDVMFFSSFLQVAIFVILRYILGCVVLYNKIIMLATQHKHINPPYNQRVKRVPRKKTTYGL